MRLLLFLLGLGLGRGLRRRERRERRDGGGEGVFRDAAVSIRGLGGALGGFGGSTRRGGSGAAGAGGRRDSRRVVARHRLDAADARRHERADGQRLIQGARVGEE